MQPWHFYGKKFGYIVAFKPHNAYDWLYESISDPETRSYVHREAFFLPGEEDFMVKEFQVKVKSFNVKGDGPYTLTKVIYYPRDGESADLVYTLMTPSCQRCSTELCFLFLSLLAGLHLDCYSSNRVSYRRLCQAGVLHRSFSLVAAGGGHWDGPAAVR